MKIAIVGYGIQGRSSYAYWRNGNEITICDENPSVDLPSDVMRQVGPNYLANLNKFDLIVRSPLVRPDAISGQNGLGIAAKITSNTNEFFRVCPTKNIIGITGTKGKGTTSTLLAKMLEASGKRVHLGGNIGTPPLDLLNESIQPEDYVVLELANFQLIDIKYSPPLAVCLLVVPEHLDWQKDLAEYLETKQQLFRWQTPENIAIYYSENENSKFITSISPAKKIPYMEAPGACIKNGEVVIENQTLCKTSELKLLGKHNWQNVCAAVTAFWQLFHDVTPIRKVLLSFSGLPFRIEFRREVNGIRYYNDSFASGPSAALAAVDAIPEKKVLIMGGYDRGLDLRNFSAGIKEREDGIRKLILIGASAARTADELQRAGFDNFVILKEKTIDPIVQAASQLARQGDAVILTPGFASFDMFKNFEDRGNKFNQAVQNL